MWQDPFDLGSALGAGIGPPQVNENGEMSSYFSNNNSPPYVLRNLFGNDENENPQVRFENRSPHVRFENQSPLNLDSPNPLINFENPSLFESSLRSGNNDDIYNPDDLLFRSPAPPPPLTLGFFQPSHLPVRREMFSLGRPPVNITPAGFGFQTPVQMQLPSTSCGVPPLQTAVSVTGPMPNANDFAFQTPTVNPTMPFEGVTPANTRTSRESIFTTPARTGKSFTTPSSARTLMEPMDRHTFLAIVEGRGQARGEVGMACMNVQTPTLILSQFTDTQSYTRVISKINVFRPNEILLPATACDTSSPSQLYLQLKEEVPNAAIVPIQRRIFNEGKGLQKISSLAADQFSSVVHLINNKFYCLSAAAALLKYAELVLSIVFASKSLKLEFQGCEDTCMIDHVTAQHLELLQNNKEPSSTQCLLGILNACKTPIGSRLLRMNILQPPCNLNVINTRLDCIEELMDKRDTLYGIQDVFGRLPVDIEHAIGTLVQIPKVSNKRVLEQRINYIIAIKHALELVPGIAALMEDMQNEYFKTVRRDLLSPELGEMLERIKRVITDEAQFKKGSLNMKRQRCFAVKAEINPILDIARQAYCEIIDDINNYVMQLSQEMNLSFRLVSTTQRGYIVHFNVSPQIQGLPQLPDSFLQVKRRGNVVTFTTEVLISTDHRAREIEKEIENLSSIVVAELITNIRSDIGLLFKVSEAVSNLDLMFALANYAVRTPRCVRPSFTSDVTSITMGRHPILEFIAAEPSVPNNTFLSSHTNFNLITGPNMSGKTTYLKQTAILQVLAQIGSLVPADAGSFKITKKLLSRIGTGDDIEQSSSSFAMEMREMNFILQNACESSLIIIDELGRSTSSEEGMSMSWAIAEELLKRKSFVLFATHFLHLAKLESLYLNCSNYKMEIIEWKNQPCLNSLRNSMLSKLDYTHMISRGVTNVEFYGLKLASNAGYPRPVVNDAFEVASRMIRQRKENSSLATTDEITLKKAKYLLVAQLHLASKRMANADGDIDLDSVRQYFKSLQDEFRATYISKPGDKNRHGDDGNQSENSANQTGVSNDAIVNETAINAYARNEEVGAEEVNDDRISQTKNGAIGNEEGNLGERMGEELNEVRADVNEI